MTTASLTLDGKSYDLPVIRGTEDETAIDITKLLGQSGAITMDPGFNSTGACRSDQILSKRHGCCCTVSCRLASSWTGSALS
jgi:hypothetical protein